MIKIHVFYTKEKRAKCAYHALFSGCAYNVHTLYRVFVNVDARQGQRQRLLRKQRQHHLGRLFAR